MISRRMRIILPTTLLGALGCLSLLYIVIYSKEDKNPRLGNSRESGEKKENVNRPSYLGSRSGKVVRKRGQDKNQDGDSMLTEELKSQVVELENAYRKGDLSAALKDLVHTEGLRAVGGILQHYGQDHEKKKFPEWLKGPLIDRIATEYFSDHLGTAAEVIDSFGGDYYNRGIVLYELAGSLATDAEPEKAFKDLLSNRTSVSPFAYEAIMWDVAPRLGYQKTLEMLRDQFGGGFPKVATREAIRVWVHQKPEQAMAYLENLPKSDPIKINSYASICEYACSVGEYETALLWADKVPDGQERNRLLGEIEAAINLR